MLKRGFLRLGQIGGVPILVHWTAPLGAYVFTGFRFDGVLWLGFVGLILLHELGHALMVRAVGARSTAIELTGFGGLCRWQGTPTQVGRAVIAWGGIWAQLVLLVLAESYLRLFPGTLSPVAMQLFWIATVSNMWMIALNLIPFPPLDGVEAWRLPWLLGVSVRRSLSSFPDVKHEAHHTEEEAVFAGTAQSEAARQLAAELLRQAAVEEEKS